MRRALAVGVALAMVLSLPRSLEGIVMLDPSVSVPHPAQLSSPSRSQ